MALRRWTWPLSTAIALALAAVVVLPSRPLTDGSGTLFTMLGSVRYAFFSPRGGLYISTLDRARRRWTERLEAEKRADSILGLVRSPRAVRSEDGMVSVVFEPPLTADAGRVWLRTLTDELAAYPAGGTAGVPVVVAIYSDSARHIDRGRPREFTWWRVRRFVQGSGDGAACVVEVNLLRKQGGNLTLSTGDSRGLHRGALDYCALYARYGMPGPRIVEWAGFGRYRIWRQESELAGMLRQAGRGSPARPVRRGDEVKGWWNRYEWETIGCVNGSDALCVKAWAVDQPRLRQEFLRFGGTPQVGPRFAIVQLLSRGDGAKFGTFWRSPLAPEQALASAYGEPASSVIARLMRRAYVATPPGPRAEPRTLLSALAWVVAAIALALAAVKRKEVDA